MLPTSILLTPLVVAPLSLTLILFKRLAPQRKLYSIWHQSRCAHHHRSQVQVFHVHLRKPDKCSAIDTSSPSHQLTRILRRERYQQTLRKRRYVRFFLASSYCSFHSARP